jgi:hypothetical protein
VIEAVPDVDAARLDESSADGLIVRGERRNAHYGRAGQ